MIRTGLALVLLSSLNPLTSQVPDHDLVVVEIPDAKTLDRVLALDLDLASCAPIERSARQVEIIATTEDIARIRKAGLRFRVAVHNLEDAIEKDLSQWVFPNTLTPVVGKGGMGGHYTLAQMEAILDNFAKNHPKICTKKVSIGKTIEGRNIWMVKISDNVAKDEAEPEALFDAVHHAREPLGMTTTLLFMDWLLSNYGKDPQATYLVDERELFFVPCLNADGYEYNRKIRPNGGGMWRKNRRKNSGGSYGVDLNRNWPTGWGVRGGGSSSPTSSTYWGTKALSEPETQALENFIKTRKFVVGCSCHTYTEILLRPWGYKRAQPANLADYKVLDAEAVRVTGMKAGAASIQLYLAAGTALDHYHAGHKMLGYTPELGTSAEGGFWPNPVNQVAIANRHQHMFRTFAMAAGPALVMDAETISEGSGANNNGIVEPGESGRVVVPVRNFGAAAPAQNVVLQMVSLTPGVKVGKGSHDYGKLARFTKATSPALTFAVDKSVTAATARLELRFLHEGRVERRSLVVPLRKPAILVSEDFERDHGFARSSADTATTGHFNRAAPQATSYNGKTYQPGADHTPGAGTLCWVTDARAGSSVGQYDVDGSKTMLISPVLDLAHLDLPTLSFWLYYSESVNPGDPFRVELSQDGGTNYKQIWSTNTSTNGWKQIRLSLASATKRDRLRLRFTAQDLSASLVEACIDDLAIEGLTAPAATTLLGSASQGTDLRFGLSGTPQSFGILLLSPKTAQITIPGFQGQLLVDLGSALLLPALPYGKVSQISLDLAIPKNSALKGVRLHVQQALLTLPTAIRLGNRTSFQIQ